MYSIPTINLGHNKALCYRDSIILDAGSYAAYLWQNGSTNRFYTAYNIGTYSVVVTAANKCIGSDSITITNILPLPSGFINSIDSLCQYDQLVLQPSGSFISYVWSTSATTPSITVTQGGTYILTVTDANGCAGSDTTNVIQKNCFTGLFVPTAFTPNGDGHNDVFNAKVYGNVVSFSLRIYNRFGQLVFETTSSQYSWDGTFNGQAQDPGAFVWQCSYQLQGSKAAFQKGTVVLMR